MRGGQDRREEKRGDEGEGGYMEEEGKREGRRKSGRMEGKLWMDMERGGYRSKEEEKGDGTVSVWKGN